MRQHLVVSPRGLYDSWMPEEFKQGVSPASPPVAALVTDLQRRAAATSGGVPECRRAGNAFYIYHDYRKMSL